MPMIFFYENKEGNKESLDICHVSTGLKKSLSETLNHYYPLAGRIKDGATIECDDQGACLTEARVDSRLQELLKYHDPPVLNAFIPGEIRRNRWDMDYLLIIQITFFNCGGMAIGLRMAHEVVDLASISAFINDWAAMTHNKSAGKEISAEFIRFFPPSDSVSMLEPILVKGVENLNLVKRRFVFDSIRLGQLKEKAILSGVENPTRVQVVMALIYRCAVAASKATSGFLKPSVLNQAVNLRKRIIPPFSERAFGNMAWFYTIQTQAQESELEFPALVRRLKAGLSHFCDTYGKNFTGQELIQVLFSKEAETSLDDEHVNKYVCTSWCRSSLYQADFGWGKPIWITPAGISTQNICCLNDTLDGDGIEAVFTLEEKEMAVFERNVELLQFCYVH